MKYKVKKLVEKYVEIISKWDGVECITLNEAALPDTIDSYFALILDVFYSSDIPAPPERQSLYGTDIIAFETSGNKDRFLVEELPLRFEFKSAARIEELVAFAETKADGRHAVRYAGTYTFYRLAVGEILFSRSNWITELRKRSGRFSNDFWQLMRHVSQAKMEHFLSDMGAALLHDDDFCFLMSCAGFIKEACLTLFCINKKFEPSHRQYYEQALKLKTAPNNFHALIDTFLRTDDEITMERKYSTAQLIARGIVAL